MIFLIFTEVRAFSASNRKDFQIWALKRKINQFCVAYTCWQGEGGEQYLNLDISKYKNENLVTLGILRSPEFTPPPPYNDRTNDPAYFQSCSVSITAQPTFSPTQWV